MTETVSFKTKDGFIFTVKSDYLKVQPEPANFTAADLLKADKSMIPFLHNPNGPGSIHESHVKNGKFEGEWYLDGKRVLGEELERLKKTAQFNTKFEEYLK